MAFTKKRFILSVGETKGLVCPNSGNAGLLLLRLE